MMMSSTPRLRSDLTVREYRTAAGLICVIKDPISGEFFRLREAEQFIAQQFDGETPLDVIRQRAEEKFGATVPAETLDAFVRKLDQTGLLQGTTTRVQSDRRQRVRGGLLYLRFKVFDPARFFDRLSPYTRLCFTPAFVVASATIIAAAALVFLTNWSDYVRDLDRLYRLSTIPLFLLLTFLVVSAHEVAHGLTCRHFGGEVRDVGFMLIYFQPALYCNVSDAWLFPEKRKRLWVGFAGPYFELFLWALATLTWRITDVETWVNHLALIVMTGSGLKTLLNFNPLIKLDGYYLLSDFLEMPNLRRKSFRYVGNLLERLFGAGPSVAIALSRRERRIYLLYGLVATVGSFWLLGYVLVTAGGFLIDNGQQAAFLLFTGLMGMRVRIRFRRLFGRRSGGAGGSDDDDDVAMPSEIDTSPQPQRPPKRSRRRRAWKRVAWAIVAAGTLALLYYGRMELRVAGPFNIRPSVTGDIRAAVEGILEEIRVDEGDPVTAGDVVAVLSGRDLRAQLRKTEAEIREAGARLQKLTAGPTSYELEVAKTAVTKAEDRLKYAEGRRARLRQLFEANLRPRNEYQDAEEVATAAENELAEAASRLNLLMSGTRPEEIHATRAQIERLDAERRYIEEQLRLLSVVSPATGVVATPSRQLKEMRRTLVKKGDLILQVYGFETVTAQIPVSEKEIGEIRLGQRVMLRARAYPDKDFYGTVTSIATSAHAGSGSAGQTLFGAGVSPGADGANKTILVTTQIENPDMLLKPEMTGQAKIFCGERRILDLIGRRLARTIKVEFWSWW